MAKRFLAWMMLAVCSVTALSVADDEPRVIVVANLTYADNKTAVCFSDGFLAQLEQDTHIRADPRFRSVLLDSSELFQFPFAVMSGEGEFALTDLQRANLAEYLKKGGFLLASAGCSSKEWAQSFRREISGIFPRLKMKKLKADHAVFHTVYDITSSRYKHGRAQLPHLEGLEIDGAIVLIFSPDGLNDTDNVGGDCCCCGGNEVKAARQINVNLLAYALTR